MQAWREDAKHIAIALILTIALIVLLAWLARPVSAPEPPPPGVTVTVTAIPPSPTPESTPTPTARPNGSTPTAVPSVTAAATSAPATASPTALPRPTLIPQPTSTPTLRGWHVVTAGDTLHGIGLSWYHGMYLPDSYAVWGVIWLANRDTVENPRLIYPGQRLRIPER